MPTPTQLPCTLLLLSLLLLSRLSFALVPLPADLPCAPAAAPTTSPSRAALPRGVVSVVAGFGADPTGRTDSTAALQRAMIAARTQNITLFVPLGCYVVTDTLNATEPRNGRWQPVVIVGETSAAAPGRRPTLYLPPRTPGFGASTMLATSVEGDDGGDEGGGGRPRDEWL